MTLVDITESHKSFTSILFFFGDRKGNQRDEQQKKNTGHHCWLNDGAGWFSRANISAEERYIHMFAQGKDSVAYTRFKFNFMLNTITCLRPIKQVFTSALIIKEIHLKIKME